MRKEIKLSSALQKLCGLGRASFLELSIDVIPSRISLVRRRKAVLKYHHMVWIQDKQFGGQIFV